MLASFFLREFDKLLLTTLLSLFAIIILHMVHHQIDHDALSWALNGFSAVMGALLGLITGQRMSQQTRKDDTPLNVQPSAKP